jgi:hypothetical protein
MAYKNQKKNRQHIKELWKDPHNGRYARRRRKKEAKRRALFDDIKQLFHRKTMAE